MTSLNGTVKDWTDKDYWLKEHGFKKYQNGGGDSVFRWMTKAPGIRIDSYAKAKKLHEYYHVITTVSNEDERVCAAWDVVMHVTHKEQKEKTKKPAENRKRARPKDEEGEGQGGTGGCGGAIL